MQRVDLLRYQIEEINRADLQPGEEDELTAERAGLPTRIAWRMMRRRRMRRSPVTMILNRWRRDSVSPASSLEFASISAIDSTIGGVSERATELLYLVEDLATEVRTYRDSIDADPARLAVVEERIAEFGNCSANTARASPTFWTMLVRLKKNWRS